MRDHRKGEYRAECSDWRCESLEVTAKKVAKVKTRAPAGDMRVETWEAIP